MSAVIQRIAWIAKGLTKAELHVLVELSARVDRKNGFDISASSRELADKTGLARASVQTAIDTLNEKQIVQSRPGRATQTTVHRLAFLDAVEDPEESEIREKWVAQNLGQSGLESGPDMGLNVSQCGLTVGPRVAQFLSQGGPTNEPVVAQNLDQGGPASDPPPNGQSTTCEHAPIQRAIARSDSIDLKFEMTIDRLQKAKKGDFDETLFELARNQIASHHAKFSREGNRIPYLSDDKITAQFLAIADWPNLEAVLFDLASERKEAGHSHGWYVTVALQRIHGISPDRLREIRARIKASAPKEKDMPGSPGIEEPRTIETLPPSRSKLPVPQSTRRGPDVEQLKQQIRNWANARSL